MLFRDLAKEEEKEFRQWARENYRPYDDIKGIWHWAVQEECVKINKEFDSKLDHDPNKIKEIINNIVIPATKATIYPIRKDK
jgi:hypothetical protein